jgi:fibronectin-binding autotransporter adhesin
LQKVTLNGNALNANKASGDGGGLYLYSGGVATLDVVEVKGTSLNGNGSGGNGGGIFNGGGNVTINGVKVNANSAAKKGGGIYNCGTLAFVGKKNMVMSNKAGAKAPAGGGIWTSTPVAGLASVKIQSNKPDQVASGPCL